MFSIGIDSPVLGEDAEPKDFGRIQILIAEGRSDIILELETEMEQFTNDPKDRLMEIIDQKGEDWIKNIPRGIGAFKRYDKPGLFSLFTDGEKFYWRLKFDDGKNFIGDPGQIISVLMKDSNNDNDGQKIEYSKLVGKLRDLKEKVKESVSKESQRRKSSASIPGLTKQGRAVYEKLVQLDEDLALKFRRLASKETLVRSLFESLNDKEFYQNAKEIVVKQFSQDVPSGEKELVLKRICWCLLSKD